MILSVAIQRVKDDLGFRSGSALDSRISLRFQEAQRELEKGKTLPKFLLQEDQTLSLAISTHAVALPSGFLRDDDDNPIYYLPVGSTRPRYLERKSRLVDAVIANSSAQVTQVAPRIYVIRKSTIDFVTTADRAYTLTWNYYKAAAVLTSDMENEWLANASDWMIGEAGLRIATALRDKDAIQIFTNLRNSGRAAVFGDEIALEESGGPFVMGADL